MATITFEFHGLIDAIDGVPVCREHGDTKGAIFFCCYEAALATARREGAKNLITVLHDAGYNIDAEYFLRKLGEE